jgi:tRNA pseudouridine38-40 synthase
MGLVAYDGTGFRGFAAQSQPGVDTVGGRLALALSKMFAGAAIGITCAGRTDAGVHAAGQVVHFDVPSEGLARWMGGGGEPAARPPGPGELARLARSLTTQCGPEVAVKRALLAPAGFDARHSALARRYRYEILRTPSLDPLRRHVTWHVPGELDLPAMRIGADALLGEHDFAAFCRRPPDHEGPITRRVTDVRWSRAGCGERWLFEIEANAFCHQMVRSVVGLLVAVGQGKVSAAAVHELLRSGGGRSQLAPPAPPGGLCLELVRYPEELVPGGVLTG